MAVAIEKVSLTKSTAEITGTGVNDAYITKEQMIGCELEEVSDSTTFHVCVITTKKSIFRLVSPTDYTANSAFCDGNNFIKCDTVDKLVLAVWTASIPSNGNDIAHWLYGIIDPV